MQPRGDDGAHESQSGGRGHEASEARFSNHRQESIGNSIVWVLFCPTFLSVTNSCVLVLYDLLKAD